MTKNENSKFKLNSIKFKKSICDANNILSCRAWNSENAKVYFVITSSSTHISLVIGENVHK